MATVFVPNRTLEEYAILKLKLAQLNLLLVQNVDGGASAILEQTQEILSIVRPPVFAVIDEDVFEEATAKRPGILKAGINLFKRALTRVF